jgi:hypothetical protein
MEESDENAIKLNERRPTESNGDLNRSKATREKTKIEIQTIDKVKSIVLQMKSLNSNLVG